MREVDDELRRDELQSFWKRWGRWLIGGILGGLALFAAYLWWENDKVANAGVDGEQMSQALDTLATSDTPEAEAQLKKLTTAKNAGYRATAKIALAALAAQRGDSKAAAKGFADVASDSSLAQPWRDLALVRQTVTEFDTLKPDAVIERLKPLAVSGHAWFGSAGEMVALSYIKLGQPQLAAKLFNDIAKDESVPETIRSRAVQMAGGLEAGTAGAATNKDLVK
ncbi:MAG: tetratricopeptide repeat protein [Pseudomonadota bacterium]